jgi:hypothetical protein
VTGTGGVAITGWAHVRGEVMLFASAEDMRAKSKYPECISGVFSDHYAMDLAKFEGKKVSISGSLRKYESLAYEARSVLPRKMLEGSVISNFCFGENVLLISSIREAAGN